MKGRQFTQRLSIKQAVETTNGAISNARSLYEDAALLFDNDRFSRAISLSILSIEESGKPSIIRSILLEDDPKEISNLWKSYRRHQDKNSLWIVPELVSNGAQTLEDMKIAVEYKAEHPQVLDNLKQLCFYSDVFSKGKLSIPENVADKETASKILLIAKISLKKNKETEESLEMWVKHLKPVWKDEMNKMKNALLEYYKELEENKMIEAGTANEMEGFLY